jgi:hypothetical protein
MYRMKVEQAGALLLMWLAAAGASDEVTVLIACIAGAYASFGFVNEPVEPRKRMYQVFLSCVIMGWSFTTVLNAVIAWSMDGLVMTRAVHAGVGGIVSCLTRFWLPSLIDNIKKGNWIKWIPFVNKGA